MVVIEDDGKDGDGQDEDVKVNFCAKLAGPVGPTRRAHDVTPQDRQHVGDLRDSLNFFQYDPSLCRYM